MLRHTKEVEIVGNKRTAVTGLISGAAIGAGLMYLADPDRGNTRRSLIRSKLVHRFRLLGDTTDKGIRDLRNRARGTAAEVWCTLKREDVSDDVLVERVRAKIGRAVSHPSALEITARDGRIFVSGPVFENEADDVIDAIYSVRGVRYLENRLQVHKTGENIPGLEGGSGRTRAELRQENWAPGTRLLAGVGGAIALAFPTRNPKALASRIIGGLLLTRAVTNLSLRRILGLVPGGRNIQFQKTITIHAPVEAVFKFWSDPENFAKVMENVKEVKRTGDDRFHWTVYGPAGTSISWTGRITQSVPNQLLAWRSEPGSIVRSGGMVHFEPSQDGGTLVQVRVSYNPPAGAIGDALATLFGVGPKSVLDDDLARIKSLFEHGKTTAHSETITREQLSA